MRRLCLTLAFGFGVLHADPLQSQRVSYDAADADGDGRLSRDEYRASRERQFARFDRNGDGVISSNDFVHMDTFRRSLEKIDRTLATIDTDGDHILTLEEVHLSGTPMFEKADGDHDGFLTETEMADLRRQLAKRRRESL